MTHRELSDQVADYINGHLPADQAQALERAMRTDARLAEQVRFERTLKVSLEADTPKTDALPHFAKVRAHIAQESAAARGTQWLRPSWLAPALAAIVVIAIGITLPSSDTESGEYELLSDPAAPIGSPGLRIIGYPGSDRATLEAVLEAYDLQASRWHPQTQSVEVELSNTTDLTALKDRLSEDPRVRFVSAVSPAP